VRYLRNPVLRPRGDEVGLAQHPSAPLRARTRSLEGKLVRRESFSQHPRFAASALSQPDSWAPDGRADASTFARHRRAQQLVQASVEASAAPKMCQPSLFFYWDGGSGFGRIR